MKFVNIEENGITKVILDLEASTYKAYKFDWRDTVCKFEETHDFDFAIVNEFLDSQDEATRRYIARTLMNMRRCIANSGHDDPAADTCVGELSKFMKDLFDNLPMSSTGNLFGDLYNFSAKYTTSGKADSHANSRQMLVAASLLSALCIMIIHDFKTHFTDVSEPLQILYPVFEEAIKDCNVGGAKEFVEENRILVSKMDDDTASWVIEGIYINDCMLRKHTPLLPMDVYVVENYTQRILSSRIYVSSKRIKEMKEINEDEEQQRMENNKISITPLTDDELKEFNEKVEHGKLLPIRNILKDTLDIIHITVKHFYRHLPSNVGYENLSTDDLIDSITTAISNAMLQVDEMDDKKLAKIAKHANYVYDAFKLVEMYIPDGMFPSGYQPNISYPLPGCIKIPDTHTNYLRKVFDIYQILSAPIGTYKGSDIGYTSTIRLKALLAEYPGGKALGATCNGPDMLGYAIYNTVLPYPYYVNTSDQDKWPDIMKWVYENVKNIDEGEFYEFLNTHKSEIAAYTKLKASYPNLTDDEKDEMCKLFVRLFLKEQAS